MDNAIILSYDPFAMESRVIIVKDGMREFQNVTSDLPSAAEQVIGLAYSQGIYSVKTHAPFAVFSELKRLINEQESHQYSTNKIKVEVMV